MQPQRSISTVGFKPDFIWLKNRETGVSHCLFDSIRGAGTANQLYSDSTNYQGQDTTLGTNLVSFDTNGFTLGATTGFNVSNKSTDDYVSWNWKAPLANLSTSFNGSSSELLLLQIQYYLQAVALLFLGGKKQHKQTILIAILLIQVEVL